MHRVTRTAAALAGIGVVVAITAGSCDEPESSQQSESDARQGSYDALVKAQPAHSMSYSSTRDGINFWIDTWGEPGKVSYNYIGTIDTEGNFKTAGYYVLKGLPVSYCTSLTPNYEFVDTPNDGSSVKDQQVPAPGVDGAYYSGGDCQRYYGQDATTGQYVEYNVPMNMMVRTSDQPLDNVQGAVPLGPSTVDDVKAQ